MRATRGLLGSPDWRILIEQSAQWSQGVDKRAKVEPGSVFMSFPLHHLQAPAQSFYPDKESGRNPTRGSPPKVILLVIFCMFCGELK